MISIPAVDLYFSCQNGTCLREPLALHTCDVLCLLWLKLWKGLLLLCKTKRQKMKVKMASMHIINERFYPVIFLLRSGKTCFYFHSILMSRNCVHSNSAQCQCLLLKFRKNGNNINVDKPNLETSLVAFFSLNAIISPCLRFYHTALIAHDRATVWGAVCKFIIWKKLRRFFLI